MEIIKPIDVTTSMLVQTNVTETYPQWVSGTNYSTGTVISHLDGIYQAIVNHTGTTVPGSDPTHWLKVAPSNKYSAFDHQSLNASTATTSMVFSVRADNAFDSIALIELTGATNINIKIRAGSTTGAIQWQTTLDLESDNLTDWYQYFFNDPLTKLSQFVFKNIPGLSNSYIVVTITGAAISLGEFVFGSRVVFGYSQYGAKNGLTDYSKKTTNDFGTTTLVKRNYSKKLSCQVMVNTADINKVMRTLYDVRATPIVWIMTDDSRYSEAAVVFGYYKDFSNSIDYPTFSLCSLDIEALA